MCRGGKLSGVSAIRPDGALQAKCYRLWNDYIL